MNQKPGAPSGQAKAAKEKQIGEGEAASAAVKNAEPSLHFFTLLFLY